MTTKKEKEKFNDIIFEFYTLMQNDTANRKIIQEKCAVFAKNQGCFASRIDQRLVKIHTTERVGEPKDIRIMLSITCESGEQKKRVQNEISFIWAMIRQLLYELFNLHIGSIFIIVKPGI